MNLEKEALERGIKRVPHARGDEPRIQGLTNRPRNAFPTPVGMNRLPNGNEGINGSVPHARGDEPIAFDPFTKIIWRFPRPWG